MILWVVVVLWVAFIIFLHCVRKKPIDTQTQTRTSNRTGTEYGTRTGNGTRNGAITENIARTGNGAGTRTGNGNRTNRNFEEFIIPVSSLQPITGNGNIIPRVTIPSDSNRRLLRVFEGPNLSNQFLNETQHNLILSSYAHTRTNNVIPTISRPTFDNFSLQRQTSLPSYDQVIKQEKTAESPPPRYGEIVFNTYL